MKIFMMLSILMLAGCVVVSEERAAHLEAEREFHSSYEYQRGLYSSYDPEYVSDCLFYEELVCEGIE